MLSKKRCFSVAILVLLSFLTIAIPKSYAATVTAGVLEISYPGSGALFSETNIYPGFNLVKTVSIKNTGQVAHSFSIAVSGQLGILANVLQLEPRDFDTGVPIWNKTISNIAKAPNSDVILGSIAPGQTRQVNIAAILPESVGNDYQNTSTFSFDFVAGNESTDSLEQNGNSNNNSNTNSDSTSNSNSNRVILTSIRNVFAFGTNDNTNSANENTNSSLGNDNTNALAVTLDANQGKAAGATTDNSKVCFWWWILWAIMALFLVIYGYSARKRRGWFFEMWPALFGAIVYVVHWILHDYYISSKWCHWWFVGILLAEIIVYYIARHRNNRISEPVDN
jgi:hypothetical protein